VCERFRELGHAAFRSRVRRNRDAALERKQRRDVDDLAATSGFDHVTSGELRKTKHAREIHFDHRGPVVFRVVDGRRAANRAGIIDENVEMTKPMERLRYELLRSFRLTQVADYRMRHAARALDLFASRFGRTRVAVTTNLRSSFGESNSDCRAQTG